MSTTHSRRIETARKAAELPSAADPMALLGDLQRQLNEQQLIIATLRSVLAGGTEKHPTPNAKPDVAGGDAVSWISIRDAAEIACRSVDCIRLWREQGKIAGRKAGGRWEISMISLRRHLGRGS